MCTTTGKGKIHTPILPNESTFDLQSHTGLRGLCALWVVLFHNFLWGSYGNIINLYASVAMPIFFILSGFSLSIFYGSKINNNNDFKKNFYRNRFARIYPMYILTLIVMLPLKFTDFGGPKIFVDGSVAQWISQIITNILLVNRWLWPLKLSYPINGPSWFVSVLWFQYMIFPYSIKCYRSINRKILSIAHHIILTVFISTFLMRKMNFVAATMTIISPGFLMFHTGMLCGFWCEDKIIEIKGKQNDSNFSHRFQMKWAKYADISSILLFSWVFVSTILKGAFEINYKANFVIQIYGTPLMIVMIISLTLDGGKSRIGKLCRLDVFQFLGKISMSLYLIHFPIMQYFCLILRYAAPNLLTLTDHRPMVMPNGTMPWWGVFIMVPISVLAAYLLEHYVETPCRKFIKIQRKINED